MRIVGPKTRASTVFELPDGSRHEVTDMMLAAHGMQVTERKDPVPKHARKASACGKCHEGGHNRRTCEWAHAVDRAQGQRRPAWQHRKIMKGICAAVETLLRRQEVRDE